MDFGERSGDDGKVGGQRWKKEGEEWKVEGKKKKSIETCTFFRNILQRTTFCSLSPNLFSRTAPKVRYSLYNTDL